MFALCSARADSIASNTARGFCAVLALSRYVSRRPSIFRLRIGNSAATRSTSSGASVVDVVANSCIAYAAAASTSSRIQP
jgi:hypothetical protein